MLRRTALTRATGFPRRSAPLARQSAGHRAATAAQRRAYGAEAQQVACSCCHQVLPLEHSHLLTQKQYPQHRNNPLNWLLKCRACHRLWENHKQEFARTYPETWALILDRIAQVGGPEALAFFQLKNPY